MKPYYEQDGMTIWNCDCRDVLPTLAPGSVDLVLTDPPYGFGLYRTDIAPTIAFWQSLVERYPVAAFGYPEALCEMAIGLGKAPNEWVTWAPGNKHCRSGDQGLPHDTECIGIWGPIAHALEVKRPRAKHAFGIKRAIQRGRDPLWAKERDVWTDASPGIKLNSHLRLHPNEKPVSVLRKLIQLISEPGQTILDPFLGSGTTLVAAKQLSRRAIGIEIEERYCAIAANRLAQTVMNLEV